MYAEDCAEPFELGKKYYRTLFNGDSRWCELEEFFDEKGKKMFNGYSWEEYDDRGNRVHAKSSATEFWYDYDFYPDGSVKAMYKTL